MAETQIPPNPESRVPAPEHEPMLPEAFESDTPDQIPELKIDREKIFPVAQPAQATSPVAPSPAAIPVPKQIENLLEEGMEEAYRGMDEVTQLQFKRVGEETAEKIDVLMQQSKVQVKKILDLIIAWLRIIPGVNQFFLEQEAKIKADKILALKRTETGL